MAQIIRPAAIAEYQAQQQGREAEARSFLASTVAPLDVTGLTVIAVEVTDSFVRYVFTDNDVNLAVVLRSDTGNVVNLVSGSPNEWTILAVVTSLAQLGKILPELAPPPPPPSGPAAWAPGVSYKVGDKVTYSGTTYTCQQAHTSQTGWEPPNVPALWVVG